MRPILQLLLIFSFFFSATSVTFRCTTTATCQGMIGYVSRNTTTLSSIKDLFGLESVSSLLAANSWPTSESNRSIRAGSTVRIPFPCSCSSGMGTSDRTPHYTVKKGDQGLDYIARTIFREFVTYREIAAANNISDLDVIYVGQKLWIPLPCSCDDVDRARVVHYGHAAAAGSSVAQIAEELGTTEATLMALNNGSITDPKDLQAGEILDVPLKACNSSVVSSLLVPNGSYALTANNCVQCSCNSNHLQLKCMRAQGVPVTDLAQCPSTQCGNLSLGESVNLTTCVRTTCDYAGYNERRILTVLTNQSTCTSEKKDMKIVIISTVLTTTLILLVCIYLLWRWKAKQREHKENHNKKGKGMLHFNLHKRLKASNGSSDGNGTLNDDVKGAAAAELPLFGFSIVAIATNNFSNENKLGEGGFGPVYKGQLPGGQQIAVKRLSKSSGQGLEEFRNEVMLISRVQHRNLVRLLGCCTEGEEKILVYEYMHNKSLDAFLFGSSTKKPLDWAQRFHIVEGIARGLLYLHRDSRLKIIHRDLKASNILLDEGLNPKISDFGMARILGEEQILARTTRVVGTYGYMSPEYAMQGSFSEKSDVFSFGVLLLEIVSGKRNTSFYQNENTSNLLSLAWQLWNEGTAIELLDPALGSHYQQEQVQRCIHLGLLCVQEFPKDRPSMSSVVFMLDCDILTLPAPKHPAFTGINPLQSNSSKRNHENFSVNDVTMTDIIFLGR